MKQIALIFITLHLLFACSLEHHLNKAIKKGYRCDETSDTIRITSIDSFPIIKNDTIYWEKIATIKDTIITFNTSYIPKTIWRTRFETKYVYKTEKLKQKENTVRLKNDNENITKQVKYKNKPKANLFLIGLFVGIFITLIVKYAINQALQKFTRINL